MSTQPIETAGSVDIEVYYDGGCPVCSREMQMLSKRDGCGRIRFLDISAEDFDSESVRIPPETLMSRIHARLPDGTVIEGVEVFRRLYAAVGFRRIVALSRLRGISGLLDAAYRVFANNRHRLT